MFITASDYGLRPDEPMAYQERNERDVTIGNDVWLGARVFIGAGVELGEGCVVSAGSVVTRSLPAGSVAVGVSARIVRRREDYGDRDAGEAGAAESGESAGRRCGRGGGRVTGSDPMQADSTPNRATPDVSILIVTYKCRDEARDCQASIYGQWHGGLRDTRARQRLRRRDGRDGAVGVPAGHARPARREHRLAAGMNRLAELAREFVLLLNPDTVVHPHTIESIVAFA